MRVHIQSCVIVLDWILRPHDAGGDLTFFKVERTGGSALPYIDVLACGNGQYGGLGNAQYSNGQSLPVRTKNVSGLLECKSTLYNH